jgi:hypothetical protein
MFHKQAQVLYEHRFMSSILGILTCCCPNPHQGWTCIWHNRSYISKVNVDQTWHLQAKKGANNMFRCKYQVTVVWADMLTSIGCQCTNFWTHYLALQMAWKADRSRGTRSSCKQMARQVNWRSVKRIAIRNQGSNCKVNNHILLLSCCS